MNEIKTAGVTTGLLLKTATYVDLPELNTIHGQITEYFSFDPPRGFITPELCLKEGDLPPGGVKENYEIYTIKENGRIIGYFDFYKGFPQPETAYISLMFISEDKRHCGYGRETVNAVCEYFKDKGFSEVRLGVSLKNWSGLKFWQKCGFVQITLIDADDTFSENGYGCIELRKPL